MKIPNYTITFPSFKAYLASKAKGEQPKAKITKTGYKDKVKTSVETSHD